MYSGYARGGLTIVAPIAESSWCSRSTSLLDETLNAIASGDRSNADQLTELVYDDLRRVAASMFGGESAGHTLQPTALAHEAWMRLVGDESRDWKSRRYFFGACAEAMRRILVERARAKGRIKRGGSWHRVNLESIDDLLHVCSPS